MKEITYQVVEWLTKEEHYSLCRAVIDDVKSKCFIKIPADGVESTGWAQLTHEYEVCTSLDLQGVLPPIAKETSSASPAIIFDDPGGTTLEVLLNGSPIKLELFFTVAIELAEIIGRLHREKIIHKNIHSKNVIVCLEHEPARVFLTGFGISSSFANETILTSSETWPEGNLSTMSPEQTGRINRVVDSRTDFYSLGVVMYHMLAGFLPFEFDSPIEMVYAHLAKEPQDLVKVNPHIPGMVTEIIMKLLSKDADDRYQSVRGIVADLKRCLCEWQTNRTVLEFELAKNDVVERFNYPNKLFGRNDEYSRLDTIFHRICGGSVEMVLISGVAGIGKTELVNNLRTSIGQMNGYLMQGKSDPMLRTPYLSFVQALSDGVSQLQMQPQEIITRITERWINILGENARVLTDVIPALKTVLGELPAIPELPPEQARNRFHLAVQKLLSSAISLRGRPVVLFLDDLQWADLQTLKVLEMLGCDSEQRSLLLVGTYRDDESDENHGLVAMKNSIIAGGGKLTEITLKSLDVHAIHELLTHALQPLDKNGFFLAETCLKKTGGNPLFFRQLLTELVDSGSVFFDPTKNCWGWRKDKVEQSQIAENVVEYLAGKLKGFDQDTLKMLESAACVGTVFDLDTLSHIHNRPLQHCLETLWPLVSEQYIAFVKSDRKHFSTSGDNNSHKTPLLLPDVDGKKVRFRFVHDRLYEAAYSQLTPEDRINLHLRIGSYWKKSRYRNGSSESLYDILGQLNRAIPSLKSHEQKKELALLNMQGGTIAQERSHFETAFEYFKVGIDLLGTRGWNDEYKVTRDLYNKGIQAAFLSGGYDELHRWFDILKRQAVTPLDCVDGYIALMQKELTQYNLQQGIAKGLEILDLLGVSLPSDATSHDFDIELEKTESILSNFSTDDIKALPKMVEKEGLAVMKVMFAMISACYLAKRFLHHLLVLKFVQFTLNRGVNIYSSMIFCTLGFILNIFPDKIQEIMRYGEIGLSFSELYKDHNARVRTTFLYNMGIAPFKTHLREAIDGLVADRRRFAELGNFVHTGNTHYIIEHLRFVQGIPLEIQADNIAKSLGSLAKIRHKAGAMLLLPLQQMIFNLLGWSEHTTELVGETFDERTLDWQDRSNLTFLGIVYQLKIILSYHFDHFEDAEKWIVELESSKAQVNIPSLYVQTLFYGGLTRLAIFDSSSPEKKESLLEKITFYTEEIRKFAESAPMNFAHMYQLLRAEKARVGGDNEVAEQCYEQSIEYAKTHGYLHEEALANELAAKFFVGLKKKTIGLMFMQRAVECYNHWGAKAKVELLKQQYPGLEGEGPGSNGLPAEYVNTRQPVKADFDLMSGLRASRAISGEVELDRLLDTLMNVVMENLGATKGCFLLEKGGKLYLSAVADLRQQDTITHRPETVELQGAAEYVPLQVVNSVCHTWEMAVLNDAREDDLFRFDQYVQKKQPRAILCTPLIRKEKLLGVLYLENNLLSGAFSEDKLQMVEILSAQIGVSLENAIFYEDKLQAERALFAEKERLAVTLKSIGEGVITTDVLGITTSLNTTAEELIGWTSQEAAGKPLHDIFVIVGELGVIQWRELIPRVLKANRPTELPENVVLMTKKGGRKIITASCAPIHDSAGSTIGTVLVFKDVTDKRQMEERIQHAQKMEAIGTLAGGIAHDFNNILSPVIGYSELLLNEIGDDQKVRDSLLKIYQAGTRGREVVKQILLLGRKQEKKMLPVSLQTVVQEVEQLCSSMLPASIELILDINWGCSPVLADATQIHQVLMNLITNAKHAITTSIGQIIIRLQEVRKEAIESEPGKAMNEKVVLLSVEDSGSGMSSEVRKRIFDPYFTTKSSEKGTGLGLATSHGIVQEHNGYIEVESTPGKGSIFTIVLPALSGDFETLQLGIEQKSELIGSANIMVVDDDPDIASLSQKILENLGYTVTVCTDSEKALELFQKDPDGFDLVITDMTMPKMTGDILAQKMSSIRQQLPIIACTGYSERLNNLSQNDLPFISSLLKPFTKDELGETVKKALNAHF